MKAYSLVGVDGNAFAVMGYTAGAMRQAEFSKEEIDQMLEKAESGDYSHLLWVCCDYIDKVNDKLGLDPLEDEEEEY